MSEITLASDSAMLDTLREIARVSEQLNPRDVLAAIIGQTDLPESDEDNPQLAIVARIIAANTVEDILQADVYHSRDLLGVPLSILDVTWLRSNFDIGPRCYGLVSAARIDTGETLKVTCGSVNVMTQLLRLAVGGFLPVTALIRQTDRPTEAGFYPMWLCPA